MMPRSECEWTSGRPSSHKHEWRKNGRAGRIRFFRRLAWLALILLFFGVGGVVSLGWLIVRRVFGLSSTAGAMLISIGTILIALLAAVAFLRMVRRVGMPFRDVMDAAERVADGDYTVLVAETGPPPIRSLARSFNTMTARLASHEQARRNLMADVAHELRTPLTIMQGKLEGLLDGVYPREDVQLTEILEEANVLSRLIEDLRTLALSETGALTLEKESTDIGELAHEVVRAFATQASEQQIAFDVDVPVNLPAAVIDAVRIRQVLNNLVSNALQHTPPGGSIQIRLAIANEAGILVEIQDTGSGMNEEDLKRAFERFQKGSGSRGSGLGLTIARNLVLAHGGDMRAASQPGSGTTMRFTLPSESGRKQI
jgi:signal transduction histidine kinase